MIKVDVMEAIKVRYWLFKDNLTRRFPEKVIMAIVWKLPKWIIYWSAIRMFAHATTGAYGSTVASELTMFDAVERWSKDNKVK